MVYYDLAWGFGFGLGLGLRCSFVVDTLRRVLGLVLLLGLLRGLHLFGTPLARVMRHDAVHLAGFRHEIAPEFVDLRLRHAALKVPRGGGTH